MAHVLPPVGGNSSGPTGLTACSFCQEPLADRGAVISRVNPGVSICHLCVMDSAKALITYFGRGDDEQLRYRYRWSAKYPDGETVSQFLPDGREQSVAAVDFKRAVEVALEPVLPGYAPARLFVRPQFGEKGFKFWQVTRSGWTGNLKDIREVLGLEIPVQGRGHFVKAFLLLSADGTVILSATDNV